MRSERNAATPLAVPGEFPPLRIGQHAVDPPVVLAPMAGVTSAPFRTLCRRFGAGLYVSEMITARALVAGNPLTRRMARFAPDESPRSIQLHGTDPGTLGQAAGWLVEEAGAEHIDLNFGCPVRKVTSQGGGAAIPARPRLMASLVAAVVRAAGRVPVTVKVRKGLDEGRSTFLASGRVAQEEGCAAIGLHARTAAQLYDGEADWGAIAELKASVRIPVLGNGDVWEAFDALRMLRETGCDGVIVGRGCLGRPWLFRELAEVFAGREPRPGPCLGEVVDVAMEHARLLAEFWSEREAVLQMRKHVAWYTRAFPGAAAVRVRLQQAVGLEELERGLRELDPEEPFPLAGLRVRRGKGSGVQRVVALPQGYLEAEDGQGMPGEGAEEEAARVSGG